MFVVLEIRRELAHSPNVAVPVLGVIELRVLEFKPSPGDQVDDKDVVAIHIHLNVTDVIGPHVLNIFGVPSMDDDDFVVDYDNESFSGVFDASDASRHPGTGELLPQAFPLGHFRSVFATSLRFFLVGLGLLD